MNSSDIIVKASEYTPSALETYLRECLQMYKRLAEEYAKQREGAQERVKECREVVDEAAYGVQKSITQQQRCDAYSVLFQAQQQLQRAIDVAEICKMLDEASTGPREASLAQLFAKYQEFQEQHGAFKGETV